MLCLAMPGHGDRQVKGSEDALAKAALWQGGTLMGGMLAVLRNGLDVLTPYPEVDAAHIGSLGLSMSGTQACCLAVLEDRVATVAQLCVLADMGPIIGRDAHDLHGA